MAFHTSTQGLKTTIVANPLVGDGESIKYSERYGVNEEYRETLRVFVTGPNQYIDMNEYEGVDVIDAALENPDVPRPGVHIGKSDYDEFYLEERHFSIRLLGRKNAGESIIFTGAWVDITCVYRFQRYVDLDLDFYPVLVDGGNYFLSEESFCDFDGNPIIVKNGEDTTIQRPAVNINRAIPYFVYEWCEDTNTPAARCLDFADMINQSPWAFTEGESIELDTYCWHVADITPFPLLILPNTVQQTPVYKFRCKIEYRSKIITPNYVGAGPIELGWRDYVQWTANGKLPRGEVSSDGFKVVNTHPVGLDFSFFGKAPG